MGCGHVNEDLNVQEESVSSTTSGLALEGAKAHWNLQPGKPVKSWASRRIPVQWHWHWHWHCSVAFVTGPPAQKRSKLHRPGPPFLLFTSLSSILFYILTHAEAESGKEEEKKQEGEERGKKAHLPDCESTNLGSYRPTCNPKPDRNKLGPQPPPPPHPPRPTLIT